MSSANEPLPPEPMPQPTTPAERAALRRARGRRRRLLWIATVGGWIAAVLVACTIFSLLLQRTHQANANLPREYRNALTTAAPGWAEDGLNCTLRDGAYHVTPTSANTAVTCYAPAGDFGDFNLQAQASLAAGRGDIGYGLAFREGDADEYVFEITDNGRADVEIARFGQISVLSDVSTLSAAARGAGHTHAACGGARRYLHLLRGRYAARLRHGWALPARPRRPLCRHAGPGRRLYRLRCDHSLIASLTLKTYERNLMAWVDIPWRSSEPR